MRKRETQITTILGIGSECNGDFKSESSIRIDGVVNGNVIVANTVIVGASGIINGDINAKIVVIGGEVYGNLNVPEKVELTSTARVLGDITTSGLVIDEKAIFQGRCDMNQDASKKLKQNGKALRADRKASNSIVAEALKQAESEESTEQSEGESL